MRACRRVTHGDKQWWWSAKIIWVDLMKDKNHTFAHANMQHNSTTARRVAMCGCRRVTHGGAQWWRSAKIIWVDLMKYKNHTFAHANMQHN
jgi:hypothetical protein